MAFGMSIVIASRSGTGPNDLVAMILSDKVGARIHLQFRWVRLLCDAVFAGLGWALGGPVGIGTIIGTFCMGPIMQAVFQVMRFRPKEVKHQDIITTARIIGGAAGARGEGGSGEASSFGAASSSGEARDRQDV